MTTARTESTSGARCQTPAPRSDFPILATVLPGDRQLVFLDNAASTQRPRQVIEAVQDVYEKHYANVHRGIHWLSERSTDLYEQARERIRGFLGAASPAEIVFTQGTTSSINTVARSWGDANIRPGDEIVLTTMEHHSNLVPWHQLAQRTGAVLRHVPIGDDGTLLLDEYEKLLGEKTRLVAVASVSNVLGTINPIRKIADAAHDAGALVLVDAAQSVPHQKTDVVALGADFLAFSGHKMLGPTGIGVLYGREDLLEKMPPFLGGGSMIESVELDRFTPAGLPAKFEAGTPPIAQAIGLAAAVDYLEAVGFEAIGEHERHLTVDAHRRLGEIEGLSILGPEPETKAGIVTFTLERIHPHDVAQLLDREGIAVRAGHHCTQPLHQRLGIVASTRASFYLYNTLEEVERLAEGIRAARAKMIRGRRR